MRIRRSLLALPLLLGASCAGPAPAPAEHVSPAAGHAAQAEHECAPPAAAAHATQLPVAKASVNGRPEVRYYVIGDA